MKLYVSTYKKYNDGNLAGSWFDLDDYEGKDEFYEAIAEYHDDEEDPEFMFQDAEDVCDGEKRQWYDESSIDEDYWEYNQLDEDDRETYLAYVDNVGSSNFSDDWDNAQEAYAGTYDDDTTFAQDMAEELGYIDRKVQWPYTCIDWEVAARDLMYDYFESNGKYFRSM